jgi:D-sedoheptulose 7-phosphate isomerase
MKAYIKNFANKTEQAIRALPSEEIARALNILQAVYERDGRIYVFGNGGSLALATHWVADFNKTVFSHNLGHARPRFQTIRVPSTEEELTAWANDVGYDYVFAGPLKNYLQDSDAVIAISSSGNSTNVIKAVELAKSRHVPVIGLSGFDGGKLNVLADAKVLVGTGAGEYGVVESVHGVILHLMTEYFKDYFKHLDSIETVGASLAV